MASSEWTEMRENFHEKKTVKITPVEATWCDAAAQHQGGGGEGLSYGFG